MKIMAVVVGLVLFSMQGYGMQNTNFNMKVTFAKNGWEKSVTPKPIVYGNAYIFIRADWEQYSTEPADIRYKAWIKSIDSAWESSDAHRKEGWIQSVYIPAYGAYKNTGFRCKMAFGYRPARGNIPEVLPLSAGTHKFELCVERMSAAGTTLLTKPFEVVIKPGKDNFVISDIANFQVYQRNGKQKGDISFYVIRNESACDYKVVIKSGSKEIAQSSGKCVKGSNQINFKNIPVGGPYTVEVNINGVSKVYNNIYIGDLWIVSGQSNAVGCGYDTSLGKKPMPGVNCLNPKYDRWIWSVAKDGFFGAYVGPWVTAAQEFYKNTGVPIGLMGHAVGGQPMDFFIDDAHKDMPFLKERIERYGVNAPVFFWYQGESDTFIPGAEEKYSGSLSAMVTAMRSYTENPELKIGIVQLSRYRWFKDDHFATMREIQRQFVLNTENSVLFSTIAYQVNNKDKIHLLTESQIALGEQIARTMIRNEKDGSLIAGPSPKNIRFGNKARTEIIVSFKNGAGLKGGDSGQEWFVMDSVHRGFKDNGFVEITGITVLPEKSSVVIKLKDPAGDDATLSYGYRCDVGGTLMNGSDDPAVAFVKLPVMDKEDE